MKIKEGFILRKVANENVVMPIGPASVVLNGIIKLNASGVLLWNALKDGADMIDLTELLQKEYEIPVEMAAADTKAFVATLQNVGCLE